MTELESERAKVLGCIRESDRTFQEIVWATELPDLRVRTALVYLRKHKKIRFTGRSTHDRGWEIR